MDALTLKQNQIAVNANESLPRVLGFIVDRCLDRYLFEADRLADEWQSTPFELLTMGLRSVPSHERNLMIGAACVRRFGANTLRAVPGFIHYSRTPILCDCYEFNKPCWCDLQSWILDVDSCLHPRGLLLPRCDKQGRATGLLVFRDSRDQKPFLLRSRKKEIAA